MTPLLNYCLLYKMREITNRASVSLLPLVHCFQILFTQSLLRLNSLRKGNFNNNKFFKTKTFNPFLTVSNYYHLTVCTTYRADPVRRDYIRRHTEGHDPIPRVGRDGYCCVDRSPYSNGLGERSNYCPSLGSS